MNDEYMLKAIGQAICGVRRQLGMSQLILARLLSGPKGTVTQGYISQVENGKALSWHRLVDICVALGIKPSRLIGMAEKLH